jgi:dTDP-4-dehydrorhamnose 3,5-epimerase
MHFEETKIQGCFLISPEVYSDERGWFARVFCETEFKEKIGLDLKFTQINHSFNLMRGTFRGLHFQQAPYCEDKLIRCIAGSVLDFILDLRNDSPTFLKWISVELSAKNRQFIFLPKGMAHGFQTLEDDTELIYHHSVPYNKAADCGILYHDPLVNIALPLPISLISEKDKSYDLLDNNFKGITL